MNYLNQGIFVIIFISLIICFYLIISNFNINKYNQDEYPIEKLNNNILELKSEISNLKYKMQNNNVQESENLKESESLKNNIPQINANNIITNNKPPVIFDPIANYDIAKLTDPLVDPRGRTSADQIPTPQVAMQLNFPTQGVLDRYHRIGLLVAIDSEKENNFDNHDNSFTWKGKSSKFTNKKNRYIKPESDSTSSSNSSTYRGVQIASKSDSHEDFENTQIFNINNEYNQNNILELIGKKITDNWYKYFTSISIGNKVIKINIHNKNKRELYSGDEVYISELKKWFRVKIDKMDMIEYNPYFF